MKRCYSCKTRKPLSEFGKNRARKDGLSDACGTCVRAISRRAYARLRLRDRPPARHDGHRTCTECGETKHVSGFHRSQMSKDGYRARCKDCRSLAEKNRYVKRSHHIKARIRAWAKENRMIVRTRQAGRKKAVKRATPKWLTAIQKAQIQEFYEVAEARSIQMGVRHEVDHIHPIKGRSGSGLHVPWNLQVLTATENNRKGIRLVGVA